MKQVSIWASQRVWPARGLVLLCYLLVNVLGIFWAVVLLAHRLHPASLFLLLPCSLTIGSLAFYPRDKEQSSNRLLRRKICNAGLAAATLCFVIYGTAEALQPRAQRTSAHARMPWHEGKPALREAASSTVGYEGRRGFAHLLHDAGRRYAETSDAGRVLLVVLAIFVTIAVLFCWALVCCGIVCGGAETLGYILFFGGAGAAIFGCVRIVQRIINGPRNSRVKRY